MDPPAPALNLPILEYLRQSDDERRVGSFHEAEFRLICNGVLEGPSGPVRYQSHYSTVLLEDPITLLIAWPFGSFAVPQWPQELALTVVVPESIHEWPYEIANDIASLLTLLCRRLIAVVSQSSVTAAPEPGIPGTLTRIPTACAVNCNPKSWPRHDLMEIAYSGSRDIIDYNPQPQKVGPTRLRSNLRGLATMRHAREVVLAARLYSSALATIHDRPDISYLLLTQAAEAVACAAVPVPSDMSSLPKFQEFARKAKAFGLDDVQSEALFLETSPFFSGLRFRTFLTTHTPSTQSRFDDLFPYADWHASEDRVASGQVYADIYAARSEFVHSGQPYPPWIDFGLGPRCNSEGAMSLLNAARPLPPLAWFEQRVNRAIREFVKRSLAEQQA